MVIATIAAVTIVLFVRTASTVLTSTDNTITLPAGYYEESTITTNITSLTGTISYTHHQCSNTEADLTYTDDIVGTSNAVSASETNVNGQTASTIQGGCYTTPYYYYGCTKSKGYTVVDLGNENDSLRNHRYKSTCNECGATATYGAIGHQWDSASQADQMSAIYKSLAQSGSEKHENGLTAMVHLSGYTYDSTHSNILKTYYIKTCGHANGELLSVTITY